MAERCYIKPDGGSEIRPFPSEADAHSWAQDTLTPGACYWVIKTSPGSTQPKSELHRLPQPPKPVIARPERTIDDMAADLANQIRRARDNARGAA